MTIFDVVVLAP